MNTNAPKKSATASEHAQGDSSSIQNDFRPACSTLEELGPLTIVWNLPASTTATDITAGPAAADAVATATALPPSVQPPRRRGPTPGTVDRYGQSDRALYDDMRRLMSEEQISATAAARQLAEKGKIKGGGTPESLARRLAGRYRAETQ